jgi:hypothetical protein
VTAHHAIAKQKLGVQVVSMTNIQHTTETTKPIAQGADKASVSRENSKREKWPQATLGHGFAKIPTLLFWGQARLGLNSDELNVLLQLISHWWSAEKDPYPAKDQIAERMGKSPRMVQRYIGSLEKRGFLVRTARYKVNKGQDSNSYDLKGLVRKLEAIAPEFEELKSKTKRERAKVEKAP